ncbi:MAG TPA: roadblock/LC7 domain-containing protein [Acidimicrobiales bacterium]|nr:roadblock/LC7 domain-containing protein [Acidimicrobiales bacterium]
MAASARRQLTELSELAGIHGSMLATVDGFVVAHNLPDHHPEATAAVIASTCALAERVAELVRAGGMEEATIRGSDGFIVLYAAGPDHVLCVLTTRTVNLGFVHFRAREVAVRLAALCTGLPPRD